MGVPLSHHHRRRPRSLATITALAFLMLASSATATTLDPSLHLGEEAKRGGGSPSEVVGERVAAMTRRRLGGPGSSPPTCRSKCGRCSPCRPLINDFSRDTIQSCCNMKKFLEADTLLSEQQKDNFKEVSMELAVLSNGPDLFYYFFRELELFPSWYGMTMAIFKYSIR
ncbi:hypothetical protein RJ640_011454 [Escallonia rubra]|uniref:Epidermal patterning factor-like protein n=1 Tax=Escallonia rubra TaxID=112253 RepID=A0AA88REC0_9ASTE|nr:hypothetical protein RJ640_011454 [Escallonia rubra]